MSVRILVRDVNGVSVMVCSGQIILGAASTEFRNTFRELIQRGSKKLVIDLGEVTYLDSTGIGELVGAYTNAYNAQAVVKLIRLPEKIQNLLQITKLVTVFEIHDDEAGAIGSFKA
jgi:anti-sigma B factor antagonist